LWAQGAYSAPPDLLNGLRGWAPRGRREGSRKGEEGVRGEAGHPQIFR